MDEDILSTAILRYETESLLGVVSFNCTKTFLCRPHTGLPLRGGTGKRRTPLSPARHLSSTCVYLDDLGDLWALQPLADSDLDVGALRHAAMSCCLQHTDVHECLGSTDHGDKPKALLGIEPFDDGFDRL